MKESFERYLRNGGMPEDVLVAMKADEPVATTGDALFSWMQGAWLDGQLVARRMRHARAQKAATP